jgi:glycosyltransferase involved in cell wall biosynthesis
MDLRALLVSYAFPPVGGAGVQRVVKLAKYLPRHGVRPAVLTAENPSVPVRDESLLRDVAPDLEVARARTFEPAYAVKRAAWRARSGRGPLRALSALAREALFPDPQVLWQPAAQAALVRRIAARRDDAVLLSGPPFSVFLLAPLARAGGLGVVLDYRDEWATLRSTYEMGSGAARLLGHHAERALLGRAHAVVTATEDFREHLLARFPFLDPGRVACVPNGYDPDDFAAPRPSPSGDRLRITYAGTVFALTSARGLLAGIRLLHERSPALAQRLQVRFVGRVVETEIDAFDGCEAIGVERTEYVPHGQVLRELAASHATLCVLDDVSGVERIHPAKIFELMRLGRPVITLAPADSALARLATRHALGPWAPPRDAPAIALLLERELRAFGESGNLSAPWQFAPRAAGIDRYDRRALAREFAEILNEAARAARRPAA